MSSRDNHAPRDTSTGKVNEADIEQFLNENYEGNVYPQAEVGTQFDTGKKHIVDILLGGKAHKKTKKAKEQWTQKKADTIKYLNSNTSVMKSAFTGFKDLIAAKELPWFQLFQPLEAASMHPLLKYGDHILLISFQEYELLEQALTQLIQVQLSEISLFNYHTVLPPSAIIVEPFI